jgi:hypothetical protein
VRRFSIRIACSAALLLACASALSGCSDDLTGPSLGNSLEGRWQVSGEVDYGSGWYRSASIAGEFWARDTYWRCFWSLSMLLGHSGDGALHGSYDNAVFECEGESPWDDLAIPATGAVTNVHLGESFKLGPSSSTRGSFSLQLVSPDETEPYPLVIELDAAFAPPDTIYGGAHWAEKPAECGEGSRGHAGSCSKGGFQGVRDRL